MKDHGCELSAICLQETWLSENHDTSEFQLDRYTCINQSKSCSNKGGLLIYLCKDFHFKIKHEVRESNLWEGQFIEISGGGLSKKNYTRKYI